jgi:adenylate cyclase
MLNTYFEVAIPPIVHEYGGQIDRIVGDAIMATWGTRGDQPDHAALAVRAAAAVQAEAARIGDQHPEWPRFRIAVNSGEALVGVVGAESGRSYTVIGDTVNVAARLEGRAPVGGVVVGGATLRGVPGLRARSLGEVEVRGRREGVDAYLLEARLR